MDIFTGLLKNSSINIWFWQRYDLKINFKMQENYVFPIDKKNIKIDKWMKVWLRFGVII